MSKATSNALSALAILTEGIASVHKTNAMEVSQNLDREEKSRQREEDRKQQIKLQDNSFENQKELARINFQNELSGKFPGMKFDSNGLPDLSTYDFTKSVSFQTNESESLAKTLQERNIYDASDNFDIMNIKNLNYDRGQLFSMNLTGGNLNSQIATLMGGDLNDKMLTQNDMDDFERWYQGNLDVNGNLSSFGLATLNEMGIMPMEVKTMVDNTTGLTVLDPNHLDESMSYINATMEGLKSGVSKNMTYKTNEQYEAWANNNRQEKITFATTIAGSPAANRSLKVKGDLAINVAGQLGFIQDKDDAQWYMSWGGQTNVKYTKVLDKIDDSGLTQAAKSDLKELLGTLKGVQANGAGIEGAITIINGMGDKRALEALTNLETFGPKGAANTLLELLRHDSNINKIVDLSSSYLETPIEFNKANKLKDIMQQFGLYKELQQIRSFQLQGKTTDPNNANYDQFLDKADQLFNVNLDKAFDMLDEETQRELSEWLNLEESMFELSKTSYKMTGGI
tara:strand:- start:14981 stop:16516 length:1536 start_codon:yes stop_codon:yes gene_type:complete